MKPVELVILMRDKTRQALLDAGRNVDGLSKDYDELIRSIRASESAMEQSGNKAKQATSDYGNLQSMLMKIGGTAALVSLGKEIINVRGEIEMMEKSFGVLLGSKEKADAMLADIKNLAVKSPLSLTDVSRAAQTLLGFNIEAEKVMPTLEALGNISMGDAGRFSSLTLAFAQMSSTGKLMGQDLLQMINAGFNPLSVIAEKTGKSIGELKKDMEDGAISSEMVAEAFRSAAGEGGKFYGMMDKQAEGIVGLQASLGDAWMNMLNDIGKSNQGIISEGYKLTTSLIQNYETVGKILVSLVATYGVYKAAVVLATAAENGWTIAEVAHYNILLLVEKAQKMLNKTMLSNPYVLVATAVVAMATAIWALSNRTDAQAESLKRLKDLQDDYTKSIEGEKTQIDILFGRLKAAEEGTKEYQKAKDNIISKYGNYLDGLSEEIKSLKNVEAAYKAISAAAIQAAKDRAIEKGTQDAIDTYTKAWGDNIKKIKERFTKEFGKEKGNPLLESLKESLQDDKELSKEVQDALKTIAETENKKWGGNSVEIKGYINNISKAKNIRDEEIKEIESIFGKATKKEETGEKKTEITTYAQQVEKAEEKVKELEKSIKDLRNNIRPEGTKEDEQFDFLPAIEAKQKALDEAEKKLAALTGRDKKSDGASESAAKARRQAQEQADANQKLINSESKAALELRQLKIDNDQKLLDTEDDVWSKRQKQNNLNYRKDLLAIDKYKKELIEKQQETERLQWQKDGRKDAFTPTTVSFNQLPEDVKDQVGKMTEAANKAYEKGQKDLNKYLKDMSDEQRLMFADNLTRQLADLDKYYEEQRIKAEGNTKLLEQIEINHARAIKEAKTKDTLEKLDYREQLEKERLAGMESAGMTELVEREKLEITRKYIKLRIEALTEAAKAGDQDAKNQIQMLQASLKNLDLNKPAKGLKELADGALFKKIQKGYEQAIIASGKYTDAENAAEAAAEEAKEKTIELFNEIIKKASLVAETVDLMKSAFGGLNADLDEVLNVVGNIANGFAKGGIVGGTMAIIGEGMKLFAKAAEAEKRHQEALKAIAESRLAMQREYNLLLLEQNLLLKEATTVFGEKEISKAANAIKVYKDAVSQLNEGLKGEKPGSPNIFSLISGQYKKQQDAYNKGIGGLYDAKIVTGHQKTGLFGLGKGKDTYSSILDKYPDIIDKEGQIKKLRLQAILDTEKMDDATRAYLQNLIDLQEQAEAAQEALSNYLQETFGALGSDLMDSITAAIQDKGVDAWEAFGDAGAKVIENLGKQLAYELFFADKFAKLQKDLEAVYGETSDPEEIARRQMEIVGKFYETIGADMENAQAFMENWQKEAEKHGFDLWQPEATSQSGKAGAFTTMTQDQGTKLEGLFTSLQMHAANIDDMVSGMSDSMSEALDSLARISENTEYCRRLEDIANDIAKIIRDGLKVK